MMKRLFSILIAAVLVTCLLCSCSSGGDSEELLVDTSLLSDYDYSRFKDAGITINVANWGEYMSIDEADMIDVNDAFTQLTGIEVNYQTYASNETLYSKLNSGGAAYDIVIPSDYMISKMIKEGMLQKINYENVPNLVNIMPTFLNPDYDPENEYTVPYLWGMVCIIYNTTMVDEEITSWSALFDPKYENNILMFNNPRDAFGIALTYLGYSQNTESPQELEAALNLLIEQKSIVQGYVMDEIFDKMQGGSAAVAPYYAGDAVTMIADNPDLTYCLPVEGTNQFVDALCIPVTAENKEAAEMYINFLCEPEIALANCEYTGYSTPNQAAYDLLDEETKNNPLCYPSQEYLTENTEVFICLSNEANALMQSLWNQLKIDNSNSWFVPLFLIGLILATILVNVLRARKRRSDSM